MPPSVERAVAKVAYNPMFTAVMRVVQFITPLILSAVLWVGGNYLASQSAALAAVVSRVTTTEQFDTTTDRRLTTLETQSVLGRADRLAFQDKTETTLDKIVQQNGQMLAQVAAIQARMDEADRQAARR